MRTSLGTSKDSDGRAHRSARMPPVAVTGKGGVMVARQGFFVAIAAAILSACSSSEGSLPPIQNMAQAAYQLGAGDEVRVAVFGLDALTNTYVVGDAGTVSLPLINQIPVRGKSTHEIETAIATLLRERDVVKIGRAHV